MPKNIVLDTSIYRKNPSRSDLPFQALARICKAGIVTLHLPYVVEREFQTFRRALYQEDLSKALSSVKALLKKGLTEHNAKAAEEIQGKIEASMEPFLQDAEAALVLWAAEIGAVRHDLTVEQAKQAMEAYFQGTPPLTEAKKRNDIPDAFIFQTISSLVGDTSLVVVAEDGKIATSSASLKNTTVFTSLGAFIESEDIQSAIIDLDVKDDLSKISKIIGNYESESGHISERIRDSAGETLMHRKIKSASIPDDNHEATIVGYYEPTAIELDFEDMTYFGDGEFGVAFTLSIAVLADFYIFKPDYYAMDKVYSVSDHNDHYFEAQDEFELTVSGTTRLSIPVSAIKELNDENVGDSLSVEIDSIGEILLPE